MESGRFPMVLAVALAASACASPQSAHDAPAYRPTPWFPAAGAEGEVRVLDPHNRSGGATYRVMHPEAGELEVTTDREGNIVGVRRLGR